MQPERERRLLQRLLGRYGGTAPITRTRLWARVASAVSGGLVAVVAIAASTDETLGRIAIACTITFLIGLSLGAVLLVLSVRETAPVISPYLDVDGVRARIAELDRITTAQPD